MSEKNTGDPAKSVKLDSLRPDLKNANKGTQYGDHLLEKSLRELGAGRSILIDKHGNVVAGNKTLGKAAELGMDEVIIVPSDGTKLVVVQRTDIDIDSKRGRELALADNKVGQVNLDFDAEVVDALGAEFDIDLTDWEFEVIEPDDAQVSLPSGEKEFTQITFTLTDLQAQDVKTALAMAKRTNNFDETGNENGNGNALAFIVADYLSTHNG